MKHSETKGADYNGNNAKIAIVSARFNGEIVNNMRIAAHQTLLENGVNEADIMDVPVPGAFELPLVCKALAESKKYNAVIALGCVIRGDTPHFDYVCSASAQGIQQASLESNIPIAFGVLTTNTIEQALERSSTSNIELNKGRDTALCVLEMINVLKSI
ncbi:MAG: 6,7-dimethyl-8-ribityllumazine synthase [Gammaproteobacteria bacterium]|nr:MAG: 6,7-dimethyl-8-ribityllumazine synthase [Gammaproteobacteria bacterium]